MFLDEFVLLQQIFFHTDELRLLGKSCDSMLTRFDLQSTACEVLVSFGTARGQGVKWAGCLGAGSAFSRVLGCSSLNAGGEGDLLARCRAVLSQTISDEGAVYADSTAVGRGAGATDADPALG